MSDAQLLVDQIEVLSSPDIDLSGLRISERSHAYDPVWDFTADRAHLPRTVTKAKLTIDWSKYSFSPALCRDMQRLFGLYYKAPRALGGRRNVKPNTLCMQISQALGFLDFVVRRLPSPELVQGLHQLQAIDIKAAAADYPGKSTAQIKKGLKVLFSVQASKVLGRTLHIVPQDIKRLEFPAQSTKGPPAADRWFPDDLFTLLSTASAARVNDFLTRLGLTPEDPTISRYEAPQEIQKILGFPEAFHTYGHWRRKAKGVPISEHSEQTLRKAMSTLGARFGAMRDYLTEVNTAAQCVIALYIGARYSELASLKIGSLTERDGIPCIVGRMFKTKAGNNLSDDTWVAIAAVRDAVRALEKLATIKNKRFLISSLQTAKGAGLKGQDASYSSSGFTGALSILLAAIDREERFKGWQFDTHQFRHSLTRQMVKAKLGLPYISFHLKHLHSRVASLPSEVSLGYGNAASLLQSKMAGFHLEELRRDLTRKTYAPENVVHGGAAAAFNERRRAYFEGMCCSPVFDRALGCVSKA